jgi:hypothetical protein
MGYLADLDNKRIHDEEIALNAKTKLANNQEFTGRIGDLMNPNHPGNLSVSGTENEMRGRLDGLERAKILTGQNSIQIGKDYQQAYGNIKKRTQLSDTGSELLRANKAGAVADARNDLQKAGVKGGSAIGAVQQVERAKAYDVNNQLVQNQRQAEQDYLNATKANANFTQASEMNYASLAMGKDVEAPNSNSGGFSVICTQLYLSGYYSGDIYEADQIYGLAMMNDRPHIYFGYRFLADPIIPLMKSSPGFTKLVAFFAVPWAKNMAGQSNLFGKVITMVGEPLCGLVGTLIGWRKQYAN